MPPVGGDRGTRAQDAGQAAGCAPEQRDAGRRPSGGGAEPHAGASRPHAGAAGGQRAEATGRRRSEPAASSWWATLASPWQAAFDEAWASWRGGSLGIGAAVIGPEGDVVARGRNRLLDQRREPGVLAGTALAHAEVNALAQLPVGPLDGHRLLTTLEPCVYCASAILMVRMPAVEFVAGDPLFDGITDLLHTHAFAAERAPARVGPWEGTGAAFAALLPLSAIAFWQPDGPIVQVHRARLPALTEIVRHVLAEGTLAAVATGGGSVVDAADAVWPLLANVGSATAPAP
jgi:tRNA(Arg) A34 adenosine deaminase TadA